MKKHILILSIIVAASVLVLAACNRSNLRQGNANPAVAATQADNTDILKFTAEPAQAQTTPAPTATMQQSGDSSASDSAISAELNDLSNMFDSLTDDLNSTDTLSDFK